MGTAPRLDAWGEGSGVHGSQRQIPKEAWSTLDCPTQSGDKQRDSKHLDRTLRRAVGRTDAGADGLRTSALPTASGCPFRPHPDLIRSPPPLPIGP